MKLSAFGERFAANSGIVELMDDLGSALNENPHMLFLGGGNPAKIPALTTAFQQRLQAISQDAAQVHSLLGIYQSPKGERQFRQQLAALLQREYGWELNADNIAVSNGSQSAFFVLFNLFAGQGSDGSQNYIHLPLVPEYIGYGDVGLNGNIFTATRPELEYLDAHQFKYRVDFNKLSLDESTTALCVSRPSNPTANMLTDQELEHLDLLAKAQQVPLIIDGAYGLPFPGIVFNAAQPLWNENVILLLSLSKLGLPGVRTGIIVASEEIIRMYSNANTIANLACGNLGPMLTRDWFANGDILRFSQDWVKPFYQRRVEQAVAWFKEALGDLPYYIHRPEGGIFLWLWFEGLPITSQTLYQRLKQRGVLIVPSQNFFPGLAHGWRHADECIRVSYAQDESVVYQGIQLIAEEVRKAYQ